MASTTSDSSRDAAAELWAETVAFDASLYGAENNHSRYGWLVGTYDMQKNSTT